MVRGIDTFKQFFQQFEGNYVIIGGTACEIHEELYAQTPRATKDIDIILIVEALSADFVRRFWQFIKAGNYSDRNIGESTENHHEYYRFKRPADQSFPFQIELFSRRIGAIQLPDDAHLTPIPADEDLSSLSAILMNDDYYHYTIQHSILESGVHIANIESLIPLKCKAYLEMKQWREEGRQVDSRHIVKHRNDVFRLAAMLAPSSRYPLPATPRQALHDFCQDMQHSDLPNSDFWRAAGLPTMQSSHLLQILRQVFEV